MLLSVAAGLATIALKILAWRLTDSTGLLSDALESLVNLAAALIALAVVRWATLPADAQHMYGHEKAEYFSAGVEGALIMVAAASISWVAIGRLLHPVPLEDVRVGLAVSACASLINLLVGLVLVHAGRRHRSITAEADGRHLLTDVWTSVGVIAGVAVVAVTGWERLDPLIALLVAVNIVFTGVRLLRRSSGGLMDRALTPSEQEALDAALRRFRDQGVAFHAIRNRQAGRRSFVSMHVLVPGRWTIQRGHELLERIEAAVRDALPYSTVFTHMEPIEDPTSFDDTTLDRIEESLQPTAASPEAGSGTEPGTSNSAGAGHHRNR
jgi:cation diffusion facilitator family transporter